MLNWTEQDAFILDDAAFRTLPPRAKKSGGLKDGEFLLLKQPWMVEEYVALLADLQPRNIFELGINQGGSTAFLALLGRPAKLVAVDLSEGSSDFFAEWLTTEAAANVRACYGVDQSDAMTLQKIVGAEFGSEQLDLIIDDASHVFEPTRASFNALLPYLRPGGVYVIEDWAAQHLREKATGSDPDRREEFTRRFGVTTGPPLTLLLFESLLALAYTGVLDDIRVRRDWVAIRRGPDPITQGQFEISDCYLQLGRDLLHGV